MARRSRKKIKFKYGIYLWGLLFLVLGVVGTFKLGVVGRFVAALSIYLFGCFYIVLPILAIILGLYIFISGKRPDFVNLRVFGIYLFLIGILSLMHIDFIPKSNLVPMNVFRNSMNVFMNSFNELLQTGKLKDFFMPGGGLIGVVFGLLFSLIGGHTGLVLISWIFIVGGFSLFTGFSILAYIKLLTEHSVEKLKETSKKKKDDKEKNDDNGFSTDKPIIHTSDEANDTAKKVITSFNDLKEDKNKLSSKDLETIEKEQEEVRNEFYKLPPIDLLDKAKKNNNKVDSDGVEKNIEILERVLEDFGIKGKVVEVHIGPTVAQYELEIARGIRVNKITSINREIALALSKKDVRIEAPIPGKSTVGIEFANDTPQPVTFREMMASNKMLENPNKTLMVPLGKSIMGDIGVCEINKMPHMLIAGTTGSGKSVCVNGIICSMLMRAKPEEVKLILVDPKVVEFSGYNGIPHLLAPVITDPKKAALTLNRMVQEMEKRYMMFANSGTKNIETYNDYVEKYNKNHDDKRQKMSFIVIIIDELADLMMVAAKDVEDSILRITQKARAAGMHLIVATQRPSTEVITGLIKANIPSRIAFSVGSGIDSRTILDQIGAEKLLGKGDMLFLPIGSNSPLRIQGVYITDDEIKRVVDFVKSQQQPNYDNSLENLEVEDEVTTVSQSGGVEDDVDNMYEQVLEFVVSTQKASASLIQRKFKLGYNRAARIIDQLEERGIIGPANGSKPREVLVKMSSGVEEVNEIEE